MRVRCFVRRSRAYKACFCGFFVIFRPSSRFYGLSHTLREPFLTFLWLFGAKNRFFVRTFLCLTTVHIFLFYLPMVSKITGVRPEKCSKSRIFYIEASTKGFVRFWRFWRKTKNGIFGRNRAYICGCKTYSWSKLRKGGWKGGISLLSRLQGVSKMCLTYVQDASNHRNKRLVTLLGSYTASTKRWYTASCSTNNDVSNT